MDFRIRPATEADLRPAGEVTVEAFVGDRHVDPAGPYVNLLRDAARRAAEAELLVAVDAVDQVLGCVTFAVGGTEWADIATPGEGEIRMLATAAAARGRGSARPWCAPRWPAAGSSAWPAWPSPPSPG